MPVLAELETASYPADEAATPEQLEFRFSQAPAFFLGIYPRDDPSSASDRKNAAAAPIGFICGTLAKGTELTEVRMIFWQFACGCKEAEFVEQRILGRRHHGLIHLVG